MTVVDTSPRVATLSGECEGSRGASTDARSARSIDTAIPYVRDPRP